MGKIIFFMFFLGGTALGVDQSWWKYRLEAGPMPAMARSMVGSNPMQNRFSQTEQYRYFNKKNITSQIF